MKSIDNFPALGIAVEMCSGAGEDGCTLQRKARPHSSLNPCSYGGTPI